MAAEVLNGERGDAIRGDSPFNRVASVEEVAEAIGVTFLMQGGPATVYGPRAYDAFCEYYDAQHPSSGDAS